MAGQFRSDHEDSRNLADVAKPLVDLPVPNFWMWSGVDETPLDSSFVYPNDSADLTQDWILGIFVGRRRGFIQRGIPCRSQLNHKAVDEKSWDSQLFWPSQFMDVWLLALVIPEFPDLTMDIDWWADSSSWPWRLPGILPMNPSHESTCQFSNVRIRDCADKITKYVRFIRSS